MKEVKDMNLAELADFVEAQLIHIYHRKNRNDEMFVVKRLRELHDSSLHLISHENDVLRNRNAELLEALKDLIAKAEGV